MRAELRRKLSKLREAPAKKGGAKHTDIFHIPKSGAGQISLIGMPNSGKSSIVGALTNAKVTIADFPFSTQLPAPGMVQFEDIKIELVDSPPITADFVTAGQVGMYRNCDLIGIVIDLSEDIEEQAMVCLDFLESKKLIASDETTSEDEMSHIANKKTFCICTKNDIAKEGALEKVKECFNHVSDFLQISTVTGEGMADMPEKLFELLNIIRIYSKPPGKKADMKDPFTIPKGSTVQDLAAVIHRELADKLKSAKLWGTGVHPGQNVQRTHVLNDKDIVELHF
jgi:hypothetical protein